MLESMITIGVTVDGVQTHVNGDLFNAALEKNWAFQLKRKNDKTLHFLIKSETTNYWYVCIEQWIWFQY